MKKFKFSLDKVLKQREITADLAKRSFGEAQAELNKEIEKLNVNLVQKDTKINSLKGVVTQKDQEAKEAINSKNQIKNNLSKYNKKLVGKAQIVAIR